MGQEHRTLIPTEEFDEYYNDLPEQVKDKYNYVFDIMVTQKVVNKKFVKRIETTDLYEMRVSVSTNEHRTFIFAIDATNFIESHYVLLLNSFIEKSSKQYKSEIKKAYKILKHWEDEHDTDK